MDADDELIISRDLSITGKNVCRVNGVVVSLSTLKALMDRIVDLHGQHEHQSLLYAKNHLSFIDNYGGEKIKTLVLRISELYESLISKQKLLAGIGGDEKERARDAELLAFQVQEIEEAQLSKGEEDALREEREKLNHAQAIMQALSAGDAELYMGGDEGGSALSLIQDVDPAAIAGVYV